MKNTCDGLICQSVVFVCGISCEGYSYQFPHYIIVCLVSHFSVMVLKFGLSSLSFTETHMSVPPLFVYGTYTVSGVFSLSSSVIVVVVLLVLFLSLSLIEWKLSEGRGFGLFHS